jgi:hypothetical protein
MNIFLQPLVEAMFAASEYAFGIYAEAPSIAGILLACHFGPVAQARLQNLELKDLLGYVTGQKLAMDVWGGGDTGREGATPEPLTKRY